MPRPMLSRHQITPIAAKMAIKSNIHIDVITAIPLNSKEGAVLAVDPKCEDIIISRLLHHHHLDPQRVHAASVSVRVSEVTGLLAHLFQEPCLQFLRDL